MAEPKFWLVIIEDSGSPECIEISSLEELEKVVRERVMESVEPLWAYTFHGHKLSIESPLATCKIVGEGVDIAVSGVGGGKSSSDRFVPMRYVRDSDHVSDTEPPGGGDEVDN